MTFLPIVERELRVASRRKSTYRFRSLTATSALVLAGFYALLFGEFSHRPSLGQMLFGVLSWILFVLCLLTGLLLGADSISEERREGTFGFLFLTDLKGYDVVLGKFIGVSLNAFYSLFAVVPVLALPIMIGGVTGTEYWRMMLALVNTLFVAFAITILVSAYSTDSGKANGWAAAILSIVVMFVPWIGYLCGKVYAGSFSKFLTFFFVVSPFAPFHLAPSDEYLMQADKYWLSLGLSHAAGWGAILWACISVSKSITTGDTTRSDRSLFAIYRRRIFRRDRRLLSPNPIVWLMDTPLLRRVLIWVAILVSAWMVAFTRLPHVRVPVLWIYAPTFSVAYLILKVLLVPQACRFFAAFRANGTFELLYCSPISDTQIVDGQWTALKRTFVPPALIIFVAQIIQSVALLYIHAFSRNPDEQALVVILMTYTAFKLLSDFYAVGWFGMWMSSSCRSEVRARALTVLFAIVLPFVLFCVPDVFTNLILIAIAQSKLRKRFHSETVSPTFLPRESPSETYRL